MPPVTIPSDDGDRVRLSRPARVAEEIKSWLVAQNMAPAGGSRGIRYGHHHREHRAQAGQVQQAPGLTVPPGKQEPGRTGQIGDDLLDPDQALKTDCNDIVERVFNGARPANFFEGFVVVRATGPLEVQGVYAASALGDAGKLVGGDIDVEPVEARPIFR